MKLFSLYFSLIFFNLRRNGRKQTGPSHNASKQHNIQLQLCLIKSLFYTHGVARGAWMMAWGYERHPLSWVSTVSTPTSFYGLLLVEIFSVSIGAGIGCCRN